MNSTTVKKFERNTKIELPRDLDSEEAVIGTILVHPEYVLKSEYMKPNFFYKRELGCIYHVIYSLYKNSIEEIDTFLISNEINGNKAFSEIFKNSDYADDLDTLISDLKTISRNSLEEYELMCRKVVTSAYKRDTYIQLNEIQKEILDTEEDINDLNFQIQNKVSDFSKIYICNDEVKLLGDRVDKIWEGIINKRNGEFFGYPSIFPELNRYLTYEKTELTLACAPRKTAKSMVLSCETWNKVLNGVPSMYLDRELSTENHMVRFLAYLTGVDNKRIKNGQLTFHEEKLIKEKMEFIKTLPYIHEYVPTAKMDEMTMMIRGAQLRYGVEFLAYDYIKASSGDLTDREDIVLGVYTDYLKNTIAGGMNMSVLSSAQLNDDGTKVANSQRILRNCSNMFAIKKKTIEEISRDTVQAGTHSLSVWVNRNGESMDENQHINLLLEGNICKISQAPIGFTEVEMPY